MPPSDPIRPASSLRPAASLRLASSPCLACEDAAEAAQQALDVARCRKAERERLLGERRVLSAADHAALSAALSQGLVRLVQSLFPAPGGLVLSGFWPIRGEPDLRPALAELSALGMQIALPVVATPRMPLVFRPWAPGARMRRGHWSIPEPDTEATIWPQIALAPLVGWTADGYRLGYGGGYFDRTLADATRRPLSIGIGLDSARLDTIFPQDHDVPLDLILTETGPLDARRPRSG